MTPLPPAINGTEQRLDALLAELRALRALLTPEAPPASDVVALREPAAVPERRGPGRPRKVSA